MNDTDADKRDRKPDFTLEQIRGIHERLSNMVNELNGLVSGMEKHPRPDSIVVSVDGGNGIFDAEETIVSWVSRAKEDFQKKLIPRPNSNASSKRKLAKKKG